MRLMEAPGRAWDGLKSYLSVATSEVVGGVIDGTAKLAKKTVGDFLRAVVGGPANGFGNFLNHIPATVQAAKEFKVGEAAVHAVKSFTTPIEPLADSTRILGSMPGNIVSQLRASLDRIVGGIFGTKVITSKGINEIPPFEYVKDADVYNNLKVEPTLKSGWRCGAEVPVPVEEKMAA